MGVESRKFSDRKDLSMGVLSGQGFTFDKTETHFGQMVRPFTLGMI